VPEFGVSDGLWRKAYDSLGHVDPGGIGTLVVAVSQFAHVDAIETRDAWSFDALPQQEHRRACRKAVEQLNLSLTSTREPFATSLERFANIAERDVLLAFWALPDVTSAMLSLLLSPLEDIQQSAMFSIQQTFNDAEDRADSFRALLSNMPEQAMEGLLAFLRTFLETASSIPEACSMAKRMVRCLTDVIDVLCQGSRALFRNEAFVSAPRIRRLVPKLWQLLTQSISLVFDRTPKWAPFYTNEVMVDWMRDALIFANHLVDQTRTFESAASGGGSGYFSASNGAGSSTDVMQSPATKLSTVGKAMIDSLQMVLRDLMAWLRLTE
jgi:senataxin